MVLEWLEKSKENLTWYNHSVGEATVWPDSKVDKKTIKKHIEFLKTLKNFHIDEQNWLVYPCRFTNMNGVDFDIFEKCFIGIDRYGKLPWLWSKTMKPDEIYYPKRFTLYKEIYIGHTPVSRINKTVPAQMANVWNVDTGAAFKGPLTDDGRGHQRILAKRILA